MKLPTLRPKKSKERHPSSCRALTVRITALALGLWLAGMGLLM